MTALHPQFIEPLEKLLTAFYIDKLPIFSDSDKHTKQLSRAFNAFVIKEQFGVDIHTACQCVVDDYQDHGIDAIYYHPSDKTLYLLQSKFKKKDQFTQGDSLTFLEGLRLLLAQQFTAFNQHIQRLQNTIEQALDECEYIKPVIAYISSGITAEAKNALQRGINDLRSEGEVRLLQTFLDIKGDDVEKILLRYQTHRVINAHVNIDFCSVSEQDKQFVFGLIELKDLIKLHNEYKQSLYAKNIRYFIGQGRTGVNKEIKQTLLKNSTHFLYLNNGITLVGSCVKLRQKEPDTQKRKVQIHNLSIVNGAQTIASAAQFVDEHPDVDITSAKVLVSIIEVGNDDFHKQVTRSRNLQNPVELSHFAALDDKQERLRQEMALLGVEYHYRPAEQIKNDTPNIQIEQLAKALACLQTNITYPARLKGEFSVFISYDDEEYQTIFTADLRAVKAINAVNAFQVIRSLSRNAELTDDHGKLIYRHFAYCIATLLMAEFKTQISDTNILSEDEFKNLFSEPFDRLRQSFFDIYQRNAATRAPHTYFKSSGDTASLMINVWVDYLDCEHDPAVRAKRAQQAENDPYNQKLFNYLAKKAQIRHETNVSARQ